MRDLHNDMKYTHSIAPAARTNATTNGTGIDLANADRAEVAFHPGAVTDGTHAPKVQESDDDSTYTDVGAADLLGSLGNLATNTPQTVGYIGRKRYIRPVVTGSGATTGAVFGAAVITASRRKRP